MKKIISIVAILLICLTVIPTYTFAGEMVDYSVDQDICRFSDYVDSGNTLPYVRVSGGRIEIDAPVDKAGIAVSTKSIIATEDISRLQLFVSQDRIDIGKNIKNAILFAPTVTINGDVEETVIIFAQNVVLKEGSNVKGEIIIASEKLECEGTITGNVIGASEYAEVLDSADVPGSIRLSVADLKVSEESNISGKIYCKSTNDITVPDNQKDFFKFVKLTQTEVEDKVTIPFLSIAITALIFAAIYTLVNAKTGCLTKLNEKVTKKIGLTLISGLIAIVAIIPLIIICILLSIFGLSCIAIPVLIVSAAMVFLAISIRIFVVGTIVVESMLKTKYGKVFDSNLKKFILLVITFISIRLLEFIPFVGTYINYLYIVITLGAFIAICIKSKESK